jgi:hypothetical protein
VTGSALAAQFAILCGAIAYILPVVWFVKRLPGLSPALLAIPFICLLSWWLAESVYLGPSKVGHTFYGAIFVALGSNLVFVALSRYPAALGTSGLARVAGVLVISVFLGVALRVLLPGIPD